MYGRLRHFHPRTVGELDPGALAVPQEEQPRPLLLRHHACATPEGAQRPADFWNTPKPPENRRGCASAAPAASGATAQSKATPMRWARSCSVSGPAAPAAPRRVDVATRCLIATFRSVLRRACRQFRAVQTAGSAVLHRSTNSAALSSPASRSSRAPRAAPWRRVWSHCRLAPPRIHFIPDSLRESVPLFLQPQCHRALPWCPPARRARTGPRRRA